METQEITPLWTNAKVDISVDLAKLKGAIASWDWGRKLDPSVPRRTCADLMTWLSTAHSGTLMDITAKFDSRVAYPERPMIQLSGVAEGEPTVWLLGWRAGEQTPVHDHAQSEVGIHVFEGSVTEHIYVPSTYPLGEGQSSDYRQVSRELMEGSTVRITSPYVHLFTKTCVGDNCVHATTIHCYWPRLLTMTLFDVDEGASRIAYKGIWRDEG